MAKIKTDRRRLMAMAWVFHAEARQNGDDRPFGESLASAWRMSRAFRLCAQQFEGVAYMQMSPSLIHSPVSRVYADNPANEAGAAYISAILGR